MKSSYVVLCATFAAASFTSSVQAEAILHAFNWKYADVTANAAQSPPQVIKSANLTSIEIQRQ